MFGQKPGFGGSGAFGSTMNTFGATSFGQNNTAFGAKTPAPATFGTPTFGASTPNVGLFGSQPASTASTNLFGSTASGTFGQPTATSSTTFGFGGTSNTGGASLFGASQPTTGGTLFGSQPASAFGVTNPTGFSGFGASTSAGTSLFGQNKQTSIFGSSTPTSSGSLFGGTATTTVGSSLFSTNTGFATAQSGTTIKFNPLTGTDTMLKNGVTTNINTRHQCITVMKEYESKSIEELRTEDYLANRKGPPAGAAFGTATASGSLFAPPAAASSSSFTFGATQNKPLFGGTATSTPGLFGQPQTTSLFGQAATSGFGAATSTASGFGRFGTQTSGTSIFGQPAASQTSTGGIFGQPAAQATSAFGTPSFGSAFGATTQSTSLFGAKPAFGASTTTSAFNFGTNTASSAGTSLFGQKPAGSLFNSGATSGFGTTGTAFGGFGTNTATTKPGGLFGTQNNSLGFNLTSTAPAFGTSLSGGFGSTLGTSTGGSLFSNPAAPKSTFNFGSTLGTGNTFGATPFGAANTTLGAPVIGTALTGDSLSQQQTNIQKQLLALATTPFGDSPLFRNVAAESGKREELLKPTNPTAQKALITANQFKVSPMPKVKPKSWNPSADSKKSLFDGLEDVDLNVSVNDSFVPRKSVKKLILKPKSANMGNSSDSMLKNEASSFEGTSDPNRSSLSITATPLATLPRSDLRENMTVPSVMTPDPLIRKYTNASNNHTPIGTHEANEPGQSNERATPDPENDSNIEESNLAQDRVSFNDNTIDLDEESNDKSEMASPKPPHPAGVILNRLGYYTIPSMKSLEDLTDSDGHCEVDGLTIGREGYGSVFFPGTTDVTDINLDELVHIRRKEIIVYPEDSSKPEVGQGLNKKAEVTLDGIWPSDKLNRTPIKDPERLKIMKYPEKIEKATLRMGAKFLEYRPETGSWLFQVQHFSKYGLEDSDEEDEPEQNKGNMKKGLLKNILQKPDENKDLWPDDNMELTTLNPPIKPIPFNFTLEKDRTTLLDVDMELTEVLKNGLPPQHARNGFGDRERQDEDDDMGGISSQTFPSRMCEDVDEDDAEFTSMQNQNFSLGANTQQLQIMKASLFHDGNGDEEMNDDELQVSSQPAPSGNIRPPSFPCSLLRSKVATSAFSVVNQPVVNSIDMDIPRRLQGQSREREHSEAYTFPDFTTKHTKLRSGMDTAEQSTMNVSSRLRTSIDVHPSQSLLQNKDTFIADSALSNGRRFRVGWAANTTMCHSGVSVGTVASVSGTEKFYTLNMLSEKIPDRTPGKYSVKREKFSWSQQRANFYGLLLNVSLSHSKCFASEVSPDQCPIYAPNPGIEALHEYSDLTDTINSDIPEELKLADQVWKLCVALWGKVSGLDGDDGQSNSYVNRMARRKALSEWLTLVSKQNIQSEIERKDNSADGYLFDLCSYLSGRNIRDACKTAQQCGDHRLAILLAQSGGSSITRQVLQRQLEVWATTKADRFINKRRLEIFSVLAGLLVWQTSYDTVNACQGMDWKRALAMHLWYHCSSCASINEAFAEYEKAFKGETENGKYATQPWPTYVENDLVLLQKVTSEESEQGVCGPKKTFVMYDVCYHLLKLYCERSHQLDRLLTPTTYTGDPLDHALSWHLFQILQALGYSHISEYNTNLLHINFACQLEEAGLWEWAVYALLHITNDVRRQASVQEIIDKHVSFGPVNETEKFVIEKLHVPYVVIHRAKYLKARYLFQYNDEAEHLAQAGEWNASHNIILKHIAPDAIINESYDTLYKYLRQFEVANVCNSVLDWQTGGQIFLDYIHISRAITKILNQAVNSDNVNAYELEKLQPEVTSLCHRISNLPTTNAKETLCQSEMAKKTANLFKTLLSLQHKGSPVPTKILMSHIDNLPMPEDYAMQELNTTNRLYMLEISKDS